MGYYISKNAKNILPNSITDFSWDNKQYRDKVVLVLVKRDNGNIVIGCTKKHKKNESIKEAKLVDLADKENVINYFKEKKSLDAVFVTNDEWKYLKNGNPNKLSSVIEYK